jgi:SAM-dependent methyltransferase
VTSLRRFTGAIQRALTDLFVSHGAEGGYERFDRLYRRREDPWGAGKLERARLKYEWLAGQLAAAAPYRSILDVGCGEGLFTGRLTALSPRVVGVDVSLTAVGRARRRVPGAAFVQAKLEDLEVGREFELVTAVEMLYYVPEPGAALEKLKRLGRQILVSYTARDRDRLDPLVDRHLPGHRKTIDRIAGGGGEVVAIQYFSETSSP